MVSRAPLVSWWISELNGHNLCIGSRTQKKNSGSSQRQSSLYLAWLEESPRRLNRNPGRKSLNPIESPDLFPLLFSIFTNPCTSRNTIISFLLPFVTGTKSFFISLIFKHITDLKNYLSPLVMLFAIPVFFFLYLRFSLYKNVVLLLLF